MRIPFLVSRHCAAVGSAVRRANAAWIVSSVAIAIVNRFIVAPACFLRPGEMPMGQQQCSTRYILHTVPTRIFMGALGCRVFGSREVLRRGDNKRAWSLVVQF